MPLDEAFAYWRKLENGQKPALLETTEAIRTIDLAISPSTSSGNSTTLAISPGPWSEVRDRLFVMLLLNFNGYYLILDEDDSTPLPAEGDWPEEARILEFFPEGINRKSDSFKISLSSLDADIVAKLRWLFSQGKHRLESDLFSDLRRSCNSTSCEEQEIERIFGKFYDICEREALKGKKRAQEQWWKLYMESQSSYSSGDRKQVHKLLGYLESVWGCGENRAQAWKD